MAQKYLVEQQVPGHPIQFVQGGLSQEDAIEKMKWLKAASPEVIVHIRRELPEPRKKGRRG